MQNYIQSYATKVHVCAYPQQVLQTFEMILSKIKVENSWTQNGHMKRANHFFCSMSAFPKFKKLDTIP